jgi:hypothetical protein
LRWVAGARWAVAHADTAGGDGGVSVWSMISRGIGTVALSTVISRV